MDLLIQNVWQWKLPQMQSTVDYIKHCYRDQLSEIQTIMYANILLIRFVCVPQSLKWRVNRLDKKLMFYLWDRRNKQNVLKQDDQSKNNLKKSVFVRGVYCQYVSRYTCHNMICIEIYPKTAPETLFFFFLVWVKNNFIWILIHLSLLYV